jgi:Fe-S cluster assembly protein SufB
MQPARRPTAASRTTAACAPTGAGSTTWSPTRCAASPWPRCWAGAADRTEPHAGFAQAIAAFRCTRRRLNPTDAHAVENAQIHEQLGRRYEAGFVTEIESDTLPPGLNEDVDPLISAKKNEPEWMTEWRLAAYRHWLTMPVPHWAKLQIAPIDFQAISYYAAPKAKYAQVAGRSAQELLDTYDKLGVPLHERARLAGVAVDAVFDSVSVGTTFKKELAEKGVIFCSILEAVREHPELVRQYLGSVVPVGDNYFAALNSAVFSDGSFVFIPKGVRCPMELSTYFRINARDTGQFERTLIIARNGASSVTSKAAPRRCATRTSCTPRWWSWSRWTTPDQVFHRAELVPGRRERRRRHLQLRDQARRMPRRAQQDLLDPGRDRLGDHLEVPELRAARRRLGGRVPLGGADQPPPAGRHRHQDDPPRRAPSPRSSARASAPGAARTPTAAWSRWRKAEGARNFTQCDSLLIGKQCGAHTFPYIEVKPPRRDVEHEATTSKISDDQLFYCRARGIGEEDAVSR